MKLRSLGRAAFVVAISATLCTLPAGAAFGPLKTLSAANADAEQPEIGIDLDGDAVVIWRALTTADYRVQARSFSKTGVLGSIQTLSAAGEDAQQLEVAVANSGASVIAWARSDGSKPRIEGRYRQANGTLGPVVIFSAAGESAFSPQAAFFPSGHALVAWSRAQLIQGRTLSPTGRLGPLKLLSRAGVRSTSPSVAIDKNGNALIIWIRELSFDKYVLEGRTMTQAGVLGSIRTLSPTGNLSGATLGFDASRKAILVWSRNNKIEARVRNPDGTLGSIQTISGTLFSGGPPVLGVANNGQAVIAWFEDFEIFGRARTRGGVLSPVRQISPPGAVADSVNLDISGNGVANVVYLATLGLRNGRVQSRTFTGTGALGPVVNLSPARQVTGGPRVAVDASGKTVATWQNFTNRPSRIQAIRGP